MFLILKKPNISSLPSRQSPIIEFHNRALSHQTPFCAAAKCQRLNLLVKMRIPIPNSCSRNRRLDALFCPPLES